MASQTSFASTSNNHRYHSHNRQPPTRQCFPRHSSRRISSSSYAGSTTPSTVSEPAVQNANVAAPNLAKNPAALSRVHAGASATGTQDSAPKLQPLNGTMNNTCDVWRRTEVNRYGHNGWHNQGNIQFRALEEHRVLNGDVPKSPGSAQMHVPDASMNQFTPEQQQWMYLSQQTQNFLPFTQNVLAAQFKEHYRFPETSGIASVPGNTCEEIEREQAVQAVPPERCALCHLNKINQDAPSLPNPVSYPSVPAAPVFNNNWPSLPLEGPLDQQAISVLHKMAESLYYELHGLYLIPIKKEECPLNATGQCPFGFSCFFEHPERGTSESDKDKSCEDEE
ncbi:unnamed protein product [Cylicocyclus nassatus]|uniref:C3H1-type domain-containing protein n=1 Tax=Cylicocyclus nassatus TaxID=53992 RepID=A0AA36GI60_CYLNA|nr:unnamed protein product [Cylicocyclus nassatus]